MTPESSRGPTDVDVVVPLRLPATYRGRNLGRGRWCHVFFLGLIYLIHLTCGPPLEQEFTHLFYIFFFFISFFVFS